MKKRKVLIRSELTNDTMLVVTDAPKEEIEKWCFRYNWMLENKTPLPVLDNLKDKYFVQEIFDSSVVTMSIVDAIGYDEKYDLSKYYKGGRENPAVHEQMAKILTQIQLAPAQMEKYEILTSEQTMPLLKEVERKSPRIKNVLALGITCDKKGIDVSNFTADHRGVGFGFIRNQCGEIIGIGANGNNNMDFCTNGIAAFSLDRIHHSICNPRTDDLKKFVNLYDSFETAFCEFVNKELEGEKSAENYEDYFR